MTEINLDKRVTVKNLCSWDLWFRRIESQGEVKIPANGITRLTRAEIQAQVYDGNKFFVGVDGQGTRAKVYIDDKETRILVGFEEEGSTKSQDVLDDKEMQRILDLKTEKAFKENLDKKVTMQSEKYAIIEYARKKKLKDHDKIKILEEHTGYKFDEK